MASPLSALMSATSEAAGHGGMLDEPLRAEEPFSSAVTRRKSTLRFGRDGSRVKAAATSSEARHSGRIVRGAVVDRVAVLRLADTEVVEVGGVDHRLPASGEPAAARHSPATLTLVTVRTVPSTRIRARGAQLEAL